MTETTPTPQIKCVKLDESNEETNWNHLPFEMKEMVIKEMDVVTRARLKQCSKTDKYLVETTPIHFEEVKAIFCRNDLIWRATLKCADDTIIIEQDRAMLKIIRNGKRQLLLHAIDNAHELAHLYFNSIIFQGKVSADFFKVTVPYPSHPFTCGIQIKVKKLEVEYLNDNNVYKWLQHFKPNVDSLKYKCTNKHLENMEIGSMDIVKNARKLDIFDCDITDNVLLNFKATQLTVISDKLTKNGVNRLMKKMIREDYPVDSTFKIHLPYSEEQQEMFEGFISTPTEEVLYEQRRKLQKYKYFETITTSNLPKTWPELPEMMCVEGVMKSYN